MAQHMRGVSATSLQAVLETVEHSTGTLSTVGEELFSVCGALDATPSVRRMLTDPGTEPDARAGMAASVLGEKIDAATLAVVDVGVQRRWSSGRDLADALELAGLAAHVAAAERDGALDSLEDELFEAAQVIDRERELQAVLGDRTVVADRRGDLIESIFGGTVLAPTLALLRQAAACRTGSFDSVLQLFAEEVAARRDRTLAEVRSAYLLGDAEQERLAAALTARYGRTVHVNAIVDPSIVGGLKVTIGNDVIDGTIASRLEDARRLISR